jgi:metal-responsive CopG/Arc/MetJ family transcriptional regulator
VAKFSLPKAGSGITRTSLRVPSSMLPRIDSAMLGAGFNRKQRSKWIEDISKRFLLRSDAANLIAEEFIVPGSTESIPVTISTQLVECIDKMVEQVWLEEGAHADRSSVIRTAITQQLMAKVGMQLSPQETRTQKIAALGGFDEPAA